MEVGKGEFVAKRYLHMATIRMMTRKRGMFVWKPSITLQDLFIYLFMYSSGKHRLTLFYLDLDSLQSCKHEVTAVG